MDGSAGKEVKKEDDEEEMDTFTRPEKLDSSSSSSSSSSDDDEDDMPGEGGCDDGDDDQQMKKKAFMPGDEVAEGEELVMDEEAYVVYHQAHLGLPCLTFDILPGSPSRSDFGTADGGAAFEYPLTVYGVAGTQGPSVSNAILAFKMYNLYPIKRKSPKSGQGEDEEDDESDEEDDDSDEEDELRKKPKLSVAGIRHGSGCINRIRHLRLGNESTVAAAWSESGSVSIFSLDKVLAKLEGATAGTSVGSGGLRQEALDQACPLFSFRLDTAWYTVTGTSRRRLLDICRLFVFQRTQGGRILAGLEPHLARSFSLRRLQQGHLRLETDRAGHVDRCRQAPRGPPEFRRGHPVVPGRSQRHGQLLRRQVRPDLGHQGEAR